MIRTLGGMRGLRGMVSRQGWKAGPMTGHFSDKQLHPLIQPQQKAWLATIPLVKARPVETNTVAPTAVHLLQGNPPLGRIRNAVGNMGLSATPAIRIP